MASCLRTGVSLAIQSGDRSCSTKDPDTLT